MKKNKKDDYFAIPPIELNIDAPLKYSLEIVTEYYYCPYCKINFPWQKVKDDPTPTMVKCASCQVDLKVIPDKK